MRNKNAEKSHSHNRKETPLQTRGRPRSNWRREMKTVLRDNRKEAEGREKISKDKDKDDWKTFIRGLGSQESETR